MKRIIGGLVAFVILCGLRTGGAASLRVIYHWNWVGPAGEQIQALVIDPNDSNTLYAGAINGANTLYKSSTGGANWTAVPLPMPAAVTSLAMDTSTLYVGTLGGLITTGDGGSTWAGGCLSPGGYVRALALDPATSGTLYAGNIHFGSNPPAGVYKSTNVGSSCDQSTPMLYGNVYALAIDLMSGTVFAGVKDDALIKSPDGGSSWQSSWGPFLGDVYSIGIDPMTTSTMYVSFSGNNPGLYKSVNSGVSWNYSNLPFLPFAIAIDPVTTGSLYAGVPGSGVFQSSKGGASWIANNTFLGDLDVEALAIDPSNPSFLYAGTANGVYKLGGFSVLGPIARPWILSGVLGQLADATPTLYAGTDGGIYQSADGGASWNLSGLPGLTVRALAADPLTPTTVFAGSDGGIYKSTDAGATWNPAFTSSANALAIHPSDSNTLYAGTPSGVVKSTNGGASWSLTGLTGVAVLSLSIDPTSPSTLYAGTDGLGVMKSSDGGMRWTGGGAGAGSIRALTTDPMHPLTVYAGAMDRGLLKSTDGGMSWGSTELVDTSVQSLSIDPIDPVVLYAGTLRDGVFQSNDGGRSWVQILLGLHNRNVPALILNPDPTTPSLYAGTFGDGMLVIQAPMSSGSPKGGSAR